MRIQASQASEFFREFINRYAFEFDVLEYLEELSKLFQRKRFLNVFERDNFFREF